MATSQNDIVSQMREALRISDPELDTGVGSVARKILDAVAASVADAYVENHLLSYAYDVDAKVDADLDSFCQLFGISRIPARRAVGTVTFSRSQDLNSTVYIPVGVEINAASDPSQVVQTVTGGILLPGVASASVAVQASTAGAAGNVAAGALDTLASPVQGVSTVVNPTAMTGGTSRETDSELRTRWKRTVFRSLAGTESMFTGIALDDPDCYAANVIGASKSRTEILQIPSSGDTVAQIQNAAYVYAAPVRVARSDGTALVRDYDYTWIPSIPPAIRQLSPAFPQPGELITVDYQYLPLVSRNSPTTGVTNRVDVFCGGVRAQVAQQSVIFSNAKAFQNLPANDLYRGVWLRADQSQPDPGNIFIPLAFGPILTVPSTLTVGSAIYGLATRDHPLGTVSGGVTYAYTVVHEDTADGWTPTSRFGLEWHASYLPVNGTPFLVGASSNYAFNEIPSSVQDAINRWRLVGSDVKVHQAKQRWLRFAMGLVVDSGASATTVQNAVRTALSDYLNRMVFASTVQVSDVLAVAHQVPGVDNVRFLNGGDVSGYSPANPNASVVGIQQISPLASVSNGASGSSTWYPLGTGPLGPALVSYVDLATGRASDAYFEDNELPVLGAVVFKNLARNSFGVA
ncbi:baseplate J/gp47 family protein [Kitasatospora viridis]|uniref:Baseplate J-like protein n=1 Tax=Kitasatospora viridis TaxID=281105 RepID=A0A561S9W7_9ACTN|nr:baseplate J/gp47 family protein [Kitasatospora viridis]TWF71637.1 baseplate J-like protein [Kitasatospora viridis]